MSLLSLVLCFQSWYGLVIHPHNFVLINLIAVTMRFPTFSLTSSKASMNDSIFPIVLSNWGTILPYVAKIISSSSVVIVGVILLLASLKFVFEVKCWFERFHYVLQCILCPFMLTPYFIGMSVWLNLVQSCLMSLKIIRFVDIRMHLSFYGTNFVLST